MVKSVLSLGHFFSIDTNENERLPPRSQNPQFASPYLEEDTDCEP